MAYTLTGQVNHPSPDACLRRFLADGGRLDTLAVMSSPAPQRPLNQFYFYLTEGCNLACRHCWLAPKLDREGTLYPTLPVDLFETAIREAKPLGLKAVKLTGGEPLLHPQFLQLIGDCPP